MLAMIFVGFVIFLITLAIKSYMTISKLAILFIDFTIVDIVDTWVKSIELLVLLRKDR